MPNYRKKLVVSGDRASIRKQVITKFLKEEPGTGKAELCSKYIYDVEVTGGGSRIFLKRPASLNKGMDFSVHYEEIRFRNRGLVDMPSHSNIFDDLSLKKLSNSLMYKKASNIIQRIYNCEDISLGEFGNLQFEVGYPVDGILMSIKWLFIEQDVTYWNWSGRAMLFNGLLEKGLC
jgi:hypothetical protein